MKTTVPRIGAIQVDPGKEGALYRSQCWTSVDQKTTGSVRAKLNQNLSRNIATECPRDGRDSRELPTSCDRHVGRPLVHGVGVSGVPFLTPMSNAEVGGPQVESRGPTNHNRGL